MKYAWIIDVLTDLRSFALANDLPDLAEQLDDTMHVAIRDITRAREEAAHAAPAASAAAPVAVAAAGGAAVPFRKELQRGELP